MDFSFMIRECERVSIATATNLRSPLNFHRCPILTIAALCLVYSGDYVAVSSVFHCTQILSALPNKNKNDTKSIFFQYPSLFCFIK